MRVTDTPLAGVLLLWPTPHHDERGLFTRTFDATVAAAHGLRPSDFMQDSQSRSKKATLRGMHGRLGLGEAKFVRCARGAIFDVVVDIRLDSPTFGDTFSVQLDDAAFAHLYIPPGFLHGFQALTGYADVCYRIDRDHDPAEDIAVRFDDVDLAIEWPLPAGPISSRDQGAGSFAELRRMLGR